MYIDPPYASRLAALSQCLLTDETTGTSTIVNSVESAHWLMTYDTAPLIEKLYRDQFQCRLELTYSARYPGQAEELLVASPSVARAIKSLQTTPAMAGATSA